MQGRRSNSVTIWPLNGSSLPGARPSGEGWLRAEFRQGQHLVKGLAIGDQLSPLQLLTRRRQWQQIHFQMPADGGIGTASFGTCARRGDPLGGPAQLNGAGPEIIEPRVIRGRTIAAADVQAVRRLLVEQPQAGRSGLARGLCAHWHWWAPSGRWRVRSALAILAELEQQGWIRLPPPERAPTSTHSAVAALPVERIVEGALSQYRPLRWELVGTTAQRREWRQLLAHHHYLGAPSLVGANLKYLVYGRAGQLLGALGWQSAVQQQLFLLRLQIKFKKKLPP